MNALVRDGLRQAQRRFFQSTMVQEQRANTHERGERFDNGSDQREAEDSFRQVASIQSRDLHREASALGRVSDAAQDGQFAPARAEHRHEMCQPFRIGTAA